jgi:hypothetical protein
VADAVVVVAVTAAMSPSLPLNTLTAMSPASTLSALDAPLAGMQEADATDGNPALNPPMDRTVARTLALARPRKSWTKRWRTTGVLPVAATKRLPLFRMPPSKLLRLPAHLSLTTIST